MSDLPEVIAQAVYGKSALLEAPENQNADFRDGYASGYLAKEEDERITEWYLAWKEYKQVMSEEWVNWKRGWWAGTYQRIEDDNSQI